MGWKTLKEHYRIEHIVCVTNEGICIGSPYIHNIIVVGLDGKIIKPYDRRNNDDIARYMAEMQADPAKLKEVVEAADTFERSIAVYTYGGGDIIEERCEELGWPNVTHSGKIQYDNTFSSYRPKVVKWAKENARLAVKSAKERVKENKARLAEAEKRLKRHRAELAKLEKENP